MATYTGYIGNGDGSYWQSWSSQGNMAHNMCMIILKNSTYAAQMGKANLGSIETDANSGYLHRYDPTSTAGWNSALSLGNEVPTSIVINGGRLGSGNDTWYDGHNINAVLCLASGASVNNSPPFNQRVALYTCTYSRGGSASDFHFNNLSLTIPASSRKMFKNSSLWLYLDLQSNGGEWNRALRVYGQLTITVYTTARPTVSAGSIITKTQMDSLRSWKSTLGINATAVTQHSSITASVGNTYRATGGAGTQIDDSWYNTD